MTKELERPKASPHKLTTQESRLLRRAARGKWWKPEPLGDKESDKDPAQYQTWGPHRSLSAVVIRSLATGSYAGGGKRDWAASNASVLITGARITGRLDLQGITLNRTIWLENCAFEEMVQLSDSITRTVSFKGSLLLQGLRAKRATIKGSLFLTDGFTARREVNLEDVQIDGNLDCEGGKFLCEPDKEDQAAIFADSAKIGGNIRLNTALGVDPVANPQKRFEAWGEVRFIGATVKGDFNCTGGYFHNCGGFAINAGGLSCKNVYLAEKFFAQGMVKLVELHTTGQVACLGGTFENEGGYALTLRFSDIGSILLFNGTPDPGDRTDDGKQDLSPASIRGILDLSQATCRAYRDCEKAWPPCGKLLLDGFSYERFHECKTDHHTRRRWLQRQDRRHLDEFRPQPWTQAIKVLRETGLDDDARNLALAREKNRLTHETKWPRNLWLWLIYYIVGSGYKPWWAFAWSVGAILLGWLVFLPAYNLGYMAPRHGSTLPYVEVWPSLKKTPARYTEFNALIYSADVFLPIIELGQDTAWEPSTRGVLSDGAPSLPNTFFESGGHRVFYWFEEIFGWIFVSLFIAGMSGIMKKE